MTADFQVIYMMGSVAVGTATIMVYLNQQFAKNRELFFKMMSDHNKEDDDRFAAISDDIWEIRMRNARIDGNGSPQKHSFPARRYVETQGDK